MQLYHTSPSPITEISPAGTFGSHLCFSSHVYQMCIGEAVVYSIEISDDDIIDASSLLHHPDAELLDDIIAEVARIADCDTDTAEDYITQSDDPGDAELSWDIQRLTAEAAGVLGYRGVAAQDEQGTVYLIDMSGRESELMICEDAA